eukprot:2491507-Prymnesium_polylepis.1
MGRTHAAGSAEPHGPARLEGGGGSPPRAGRVSGGRRQRGRRRVHGGASMAARPWGRASADRRE